MTHLGPGWEVRRRGRVEGQCQGVVYIRRVDRYTVLQCLHPECNYNVQGFDVELVVQDWNSHLRFPTRGRAAR